MSEPLPAEVRTQVVAFAADTLADLEDAEVPASLVAVRRFTPARRAKQGAVPLAAAVEHDAMFRGRVADWIRRTHPGLAEAVTAADGPPAAAPPAEVAAVAFVLRPSGWEELLAAAASLSAQDALSARADEAAREVDRLSEALVAQREAVRAEREQLREQLASSRQEADELRRRMRGTSERVRRAEQVAQEEVAAAVADRDAARAAPRAAETEVRRLRGRVGDLEAALAAARREGRDARSLDDARLRVLLDTLMGAANGVRRELGLPSTVSRPADLLASADARTGDPFSAVGARGRPEDDPTVIDEVLAIPGVHLLIDGYNVTKRGYGGLTLQAQRVRLLSGLGPLAGRALEAEITVVFDATAVASRPVGVTAPRGVRVLFSRLGELADEEIVRLVRAEPPGRPIVVVTSDREVAEACASAGARAVPSAALLSRLER
ncbi:NYN domain-containing protein [Frankia sp. CNm7]|uniref:NYN domain-containing protein n=1 Tax=Frankia nepalensis TaxID=1836974 RepID=UPI001934168C|nr:NYN domain-containing protein [Frankia nepalensis]MBL7522586.1 NYN domain-containing protein [Frankia nepalensis]